MIALPPFAAAPLGLLAHVPNELRGRHCHDTPYVAIVLEGGYQEAGDEGRFDVGPGDALIHHDFESHLDRVEARGARVLILDLPPTLAGASHVRGRVRDPDALVRVASRDAAAAAALLVEDFTAVPAAARDWPDLLARDLRTLTPFALADWAETHGVRAETLSRGFRAAYGCTPKAYRADVRARAALAAARASGESFAAIAHRLHFTDQAHMTRAVARISGVTPGRWRARQLITIQR
ncbi:helix-turn-helix domain-containing protein [Sphingopyxis granuli]|uniref:Transcriptional regulator, AraC family n=1 Tax=Sphingopyxis granuli TaxID=267128 RepID=A0AA86GKN1_9SPHN|nr:helix-turn-helix domain-containing protein [Sphingopyxis granuli]AMG74443.1 Transcriptional regulator, AraC family [Sphingopyxis granuli]